MLLPAIVVGESELIQFSSDSPTTLAGSNVRMYYQKLKKYSLEAPDDEQKYRSKHVEQSRDNKLYHTDAPCWSFQ